jgi:hypothetical protein|tara:strand:+ start:1593 stop:1832 length:240 start_codon:yes stop_codon:yes gene_type:complete
MEDINMTNNIDCNKMMTDNDTSLEKFLYQIDISIETGDVSYIQKAINDYKYLVSQQVITWANNIIIEILTEKMEEEIIF